MRLTLLQTVRLHQAIESIRAREDLNKKFAYALIRTRAATQPVYDAVAEMEKLSPGMQAYEEKRLEALRRHGRRKENGEYEMNGTHVVLENPAAFESEFLALGEAHRADLEAHRAAQQQVQEHIQQEEEVAVHRVPFDLVPETISPDVLEKLEPMIEPPAP